MERMPEQRKASRPRKTEQMYRDAYEIAIAIFGETYASGVGSLLTEPTVAALSEGAQKDSLKRAMSLAASVYHSHEVELARNAEIAEQVREDGGQPPRSADW
jgi:hypothetical protein